MRLLLLCFADFYFVKMGQWGASGRGHLSRPEGICDSCLGGVSRVGLTVFD